MRQKHLREALRVKEYTLYSAARNKSHHLWNTNWLLLGWIPSELGNILGGKTGYIPESGYNFVIQVANDAGHGLTVVVLGAATHEARFTEARDIADWTFEHYIWPQ